MAKKLHPLVLALALSTTTAIVFAQTITAPPNTTTTTTPRPIQPTSPPPSPSSSSNVPFPLNSAGDCTNYTVCIDYLNACSLKYGGCFDACPGAPRPTFPDPGCVGYRDPDTGENIPLATLTKAPRMTTRTSACGEKCELFADACGNVFGPGCYESCTEREPVVPTYSRPYCERDGVSTTTTTSTALALEAPLTTVA